MITIEQATFAYEDMLMNFSLEVPRGSFMAVTGPSGAGKSTLLALIAGFEQPLSGKIVIDDEDMSGIRPAARPLSMIFQDNNSFAHLTVWQNVALGVAPNLKLTRGQQHIVDQALQRVGLNALKQRKPGELSGGERQRIAIARALVRHQPILLLDEPFTALGPALRSDMLDLILALKQEHSLTVMLVTHQPEDVRGKADQLAFLKDGEVRHVLSSEHYFAATAPQDIRAYLGD